MPEVPTIAESGSDLGLSRFDIHTWFGLFGPAKLPAEITARLNKAFVDALNAADVKARLATSMAEPAPSTPEAFAQFVRSEHAKYESIVKASGAKADSAGTGRYAMACHAFLMAWSRSACKPS